MRAAGSDHKCRQRLGMSPNNVKTHIIVQSTQYKAPAQREPNYYSKTNSEMSSVPHSPQLGVDYGSRMEGGVFGAVARANERKRAKLARDDAARVEAKARRQRYEQQRAARDAAKAEVRVVPFSYRARHELKSCILSSPCQGLTCAAPTDVDHRPAPARPQALLPAELQALTQSSQLVPPEQVCGLLADLNGGVPPRMDEVRVGTRDGSAKAWQRDGKRDGTAPGWQRQATWGRL